MEEPKKGLFRYAREWQESSYMIPLVGQFVIVPDSRWYLWWTHFILIAATYSSIFTPIEFGFFRGLPKRLAIFDSAVQIIFLTDVVVNFFVAFKDKATYKLISSHKSIALRYIKTDFIPDLVACLPWDFIYKTANEKEGVRCMLWIRLYRVRKVERFFQRLEKDMRVHYFAARIAKLLVVEFYCTHTAACIFYYLATTLPPSREGYTWIGSLRLGAFSYDNFRSIDLKTRYMTALYWAILTMATVGYGDIHAVNTREMVFVMIFVSFDMILGAYLIGNMTALIVKGSTTEAFRDRMNAIAKFASAHQLPKELRHQMKTHVRLEFEGQLTERMILKEFPASIRAEVSQALYRKAVAAVSLFENCSPEFINQIVSRVHREYFLPGDVIMEQGGAADRLYIVYHGALEEVFVAEDGSEETFVLEAFDIFGEIAVMCGIPQPYTVRVNELSSLLRLDKQAFTNMMAIYSVDSRQLFNNLLKRKTSDVRIRQFADDIQAQLSSQQADLAAKMNAASFQGDLIYMKRLMRAGADPTKADYAGRTPLHLASARGYEEVVLTLLHAGADVNAVDNFGSSPLLEAIKNGHDCTAKLLVDRGAKLRLREPGSVLCSTVINGNFQLLKRLIKHGANPNASDYDLHTPLHVAAAEGLHVFVTLLLRAGASVTTKDRWGHTPLDEAKQCGSRLVISALEDALQHAGEHQHQQQQQASTSVKSQMMQVPMLTKQASARSSSSKQLQSPRSLTDYNFASGLHQGRTCVLVPGDPGNVSTQRRHGIVVDIPSTVEELLDIACDLFGGNYSRLVDERGDETKTLERVSSLDKLYAVSSKVDVPTDK